MNKTVNAPFGPDIVRRLQWYQQSGMFHPYTCGANHGSDEARTLVVSEEGMRCPTCDSLQTWAHEPPSDTLIAIHERAPKGRPWDIPRDEETTRLCQLLGEEMKAEQL